ncbi:MAG: squalene--hopene cyclase, partial [Candidatus Binatia bacterium]
MGHGTIISTDHQAIQERKIRTPDGLHLSQLERAIHHAASALLGLQHPDGYWCFELEADCTIPAEYILMMHYMAAVDDQLERKLTTYLRARQG